MANFEYYYSGTAYVSESLDALLMLFALAFFVTGYVLYSLGLYAIARRRGIRNPWLAWVPVGDLWVLGSISDQYQYLVKGRVNIRRRILMILSVVVVLLYVLCAYCVLASDTANDDAAMAVLLAFVAILALLAAAIALMVYQYMCCYDLFRSCDRDNGALYLIMCFLFSGVMSFLVFACRKKDEGMPPRRQPISAPVQEIPEEPAEETSQEILEEESKIEGGTPDEQTIPVADD